MLEGGYVEIDPWEWGGPVTFEAKVRYNSPAGTGRTWGGGWGGVGRTWGEVGWGGVESQNSRG